jgi:quinol monooxygenase YgiN
MIRINCFFKASSEKEDAMGKALEAAKALTAKSLGHEGCIAYDVFASATREDVFMICETWKDQACLDKHSATPEFAEYVGIIQENGLLKIETFEF